MKYYYPILYALFLLNSCTNKYTIADKNVNDEVIESSTINSYKLLDNFFVKSHINPDLFKKSFIDNEKDFYSIFGFDNSKTIQSNPIDFDKEFVIPIILEKSNIVSKIIVDEIHIVDNEVLIKYTINQLNKISYLVQPAEIIILEKNRIRDLKKLKLKISRTKNLL